MSILAVTLAENVKPWYGRGNHSYDIMSKSASFQTGRISGKIIATVPNKNRRDKVPIIQDVACRFRVVIRP